MLRDNDLDYAHVVADIKDKFWRFSVVPNAHEAIVQENINDLHQPFLGYFGTFEDSPELFSVEGIPFADKVIYQRRIIAYDVGQFLISLGN
jgi:hypothetical protein